MTLPSLELLLPAFTERDAVRKYAEHNVDLWRRTVGGLRLAQEKRRPFDPRADYWRYPERRLLVAYFVRRFAGCYAPANALRRLAFGVFRHFDTARAQNHLGEPFDADEQNERWPDLCAGFRAVASGLPEASREYADVAAVWGTKTLGGDTLRESLNGFIDETAETGILDAEDPLGKRIAWFPYIGLGSLDALTDAQRFFFGFYTAFTSTNSYQSAGAQTFAPILQNTSMSQLVDYAARWAKGEPPSETKFLVLGREGYEPRDCSHYNTVTELYGFLNLQRGPIFNNASADAYAAYGKAKDVGNLPRVLRVGEETRAFLAGRPSLVDALVKELAQVRTTPWGNLIEFEGIRGRKVPARRASDVALLADRVLRDDVGKHFGAYLDSLGKVDAAAAFLNVLLDAVLYAGSVDGDAPPSSGKPPRTDRPPVAPREDSRRLVLPASLRPIAEEALALLRAGFHVLLAGAPGTGKTTVGQLIGHAWNSGLAHVPLDIARASAPRTVVAHSAWATFHTVGGLLPDERGAFVVRPGIFVEPLPSGDQGVWQLRGECFVLDEMNRADLDRCIGDLYPILSHSVAEVAPAGLPGVNAIRDNERFRILATVNDATLDDIVFPISEGLARRFLRIDLLGATAQEVKDFLGFEGADGERLEAANDVVVRLFDAAATKQKLSKTERGDHLPFGVGYFSPLKAWVAGELRLAIDPDATVQARRVLVLALRGMARVRGFEPVLKELEKDLEG